MKFLFSIYFISLVSFCFSQEIVDMQEFNDIFKPENKTEKFTYALKNNKNELQVISSTIFLFYKEFVSSQDTNVCPYSPSCSVYAHESIKKKGLFFGLIDSFDRFSRCNNFTPEQYHIHNGKLIDTP